jgi:tetratricopeptide (TPR) repeat protein
MGYVWLLSDGLRGRVMNKSEIDALAADEHNWRRERRIRQHNTEPFFVNDCDTASFLYLAVAEVLELPLSMIEIPGHNFVRFQDGNEYFEWETIYGFERWSTENYRIIWNILPYLVETKVYLSPMSMANVIGYHSRIVADIWSKKKQYRRALMDYEKAAALYPRSPKVWGSWAWNLAVVGDATLRDGRRAIEYARRAVALSRTPNNLDTLACAYAETGDFKDALATERDAQSLHTRRNDYPFEHDDPPDFTKKIGLFEKGLKCSGSATTVAQELDAANPARAQLLEGAARLGDVAIPKSTLEHSSSFIKLP